MIPDSFCADACSDLAEPQWGTAPYVQALLLVSWPKGLWAPEALHTPGLPESVATWPSAQAKRGIKAACRLVWRPDERADAGVRLFRFPDAVEAGPLPLHEVAEALDASSERPGGPWRPIERPMLVVCTHGKHDRCCAKLGQAVADVARAMTPTSDWAGDVWDSSHLGGHRFAATALELPGGRMWGRLAAGHVVRWLEALGDGRVVSELYRGNIFQEPAMQVAEGFGWSVLAGRRGAVRIAGLSPIAHGRVDVDVDVRPVGHQGSSFRVVASEAMFLGATSCDELDAPKPYGHIVLESATEREPPPPLGPTG